MRFTVPCRAGRIAEDEVRQQRWGTHADEIETSMILYMQPVAARMGRAMAPAEHLQPAPLTRDPRRSGRDYSPSGASGDPILSTWLKGEKITEAAVAEILRDIDALTAAALPAGSAGAAPD